jgi:hypothetical protein
MNNDDLLTVVFICYNDTGTIVKPIKLSSRSSYVYQSVCKST